MELTQDLTLEQSKEIYNKLQSKGWVLQMENENPFEAFNFFDDTISFAQIEDSFYVDIQKFFTSLTCITDKKDYEESRQDLLDVFGPYAREWN